MTDAMTWGAKKYLSGFQHLSVGFDSLKGSIFEGYEMTGLRVGDRKTPAIVTAAHVFFALDPRKSWERRKVAFRFALDGLRVDENSVQRVADAALKEFPPSAEPQEPDDKPLEIMNFILPLEISARDWAGAKGWKFDSFRLAQPDPQKCVCTFDLSAAYQNIPLKLDGEAELAPTALPLGLKARAHVPDADVRTVVSLSGGVIDVKDISGKLFSSSLKGTARVDTNQSDVPIRADISLGAADFSTLRRWIPGLSSAAFDGLEIHVAGSVQKPGGTAKLKNGRVAWQGFKADEIGADLEIAPSKAAFDFSAGVLGSVVSAKGSVGLGGAMPLSVKVGVSPLRLANLSQILPGLSDAGLDGAVSASAVIGGTVSAPKADLSVNSPRVSAMGQYDVGDIALKATATAKEIVLENLSARAFNGAIQARGRVDIAGKSPSIDVGGSLRGIDLSSIRPDSGFKGILDATFDVAGTPAKPQIALEAGISEFDAGQYGAKNLTLTARGSDKLDVRVSGMTKHDTPFGGGGTIGLPLGGRTSSLDLLFRLDDIKLAELMSNTMKYSGDISADVTVKGSFEKPDVKAEMHSDQIQASGFTIVDPQARAALNGTRLDVEASLALGDRRPTATGYVDFTHGLKGAFDVKADEIRIDAIQPSLGGTVDGRVSLNARAEIDGGNVSATASLTSPLVAAAGARIENISVPVVFSKNRVAVPNGTFLIGGSTLHLNAGGSVDTGNYEFSLEGEGIDLLKLTQPMGLPSQIGGSASVRFNGTARGGVTTIMQGNGRLRFNDVTVDKFPGQGAISGSDPFKIQHANVFFNVNDGEVTLMPGSAITSWPDDRLYHFVSFTGLVWRQARTPPKLDPSMMPEDLAKRAGDMYHIYVNGSVNARVIDVALGGLGAVLDAGASGDMSKENIASNFVQKLIGGAFSSPVRDVDIEVAGKDYSEVRVSKLKFGGEGSYDDVATTDWTEDDTSQNSERRYSISYPLPVGRDPSKPRTGRRQRSRRQK